MNALIEIATVAFAPARLAIGGNNPPEPTPYEAIKTHVDDLFTEAKNWLDGTAIASQAQADEVSFLLDQLRKGAKAAEEARKTETKPIDEAKAEVQARYKPLLSTLDTAAAGCKAALAPWLAKVEAEQRELAEASRRAAEALAEQAREAAAAAAANDLAAVAAAEALIDAAKQADKDATKAGKLRSAATGGARAVTLRSYWSAEITDLKEACRHYWATNPEAFRPLIQQLASTDVQAGKRVIPGVTAIEDRRAV